MIGEKKKGTKGMGRNEKGQSEHSEREEMNVK
jgi:hypothetical protein